MKGTILVLTAAILGCNGSSIYDQRGSTQTGSGGTEGLPSPGSGGGSSSSSSPSGTGGALDEGGATGSATGGGGVGASVSGAGGSTASGAGGASNGAPATGGATAGGSDAGADLGVPWDGGTSGALGRDSGTPGSGGIVGSGGATSGAGAPGTGGTAGFAGATGTGGAPSSGGSTTTAPSGTGGVQGAGGATGAGGSSSACVPAANPGAKGMNAGQACVSCHGSRQSPTITLGGTVYSSASGGSGVSGATVTITDNNGKKTTIVTGSSGNFYTGTSIAFPAKVQVSKCPDTASMGTTITTGDCNSCHNSSMRLHLP